MITVLDSLEGVDEALHGEYEERDGKFFLKLEGDAPKGYATAADLATSKGNTVTMRDRNTALLGEIAKLAGVDETEDLEPLKALLATFEGIDPDEFRTLKDEAGKLKKKTGVTKADDIAAIVKEQVALGITPFREKFEAAETARAAAQESADRALLRERIGAKALKAGAIPGAVNFLLGEAASTFEVVDNEVVARPGKFSAVDAGEPIGIDEWINAAGTLHDFAFKGSSGSSADHGRGTTPTGMKELVNPTPEELGDPKISAAIDAGKLKLVTK